MKTHIILLVFLTSLITVQAQDTQSGEELFRSYCKACHNIDKKLVGPALKDVHIRRDREWLYAFIKNSQEMIDAGDSLGMSLFMEYNQIPMPPQRINDEQIASILAYIEIESQPKAPDANPIKRPAVDYGPVPTLMRFDNYLFWIPFTLIVIMFIFMLYYMTVVQDFSKSTVSAESD